MYWPRLVIFASGTKTGGGSGFLEMVKSWDLKAIIAAVVSNHEHGGVRHKADFVRLPFEYFAGPYDAQHCRELLRMHGAPWAVLSGWLKKLEGLDPARTINSHPALLTFQERRFGGIGMHGRHVHEAVKIALDAGEINESGFTMHFVTEEYDQGPIFAEIRVPLCAGMSAEEIGKRVSAAEHAWQPFITNEVVYGRIRLAKGVVEYDRPYSFIPRL